MSERLVDVLNSRDTVLHTYPITLGDPNTASGTVGYEEKALQAAAYAHLVPDADLNGLTTRMHVSRGGPLTSYGDGQDILDQTKQSLDQIVRERAYWLWQQEGCPDGQADDYWRRAHDQHLRERAYFLWLQNGCPEGQADDHWHQTSAFETP